MLQPRHEASRLVLSMLQPLGGPLDPVSAPRRSVMSGAARGMSPHSALPACRVAGLVRSILLHLRAHPDRLSCPVAVLASVAERLKWTFTSRYSATWTAQVDLSRLQIASAEDWPNAGQSDHGNSAASLVSSSSSNATSEGPSFPGLLQTSTALSLLDKTAAALVVLCDMHRSSRLRCGQAMKICLSNSRTWTGVIAGACEAGHLASWQPSFRASHFALLFSSHSITDRR